jgi:L-2-amino-thiazoline-4-carboxylic acid hydrolase
MGLKLTLLSLWLPNYFLSRELSAVSDATTQALKETIRVHAPNAQVKAQSPEIVGTIDEKRAAMAKQHAVLVDALAEALGQEAAVQVGRESLFAVGEQLGKQNRDRLGVGDSPEDLVKAAKIMYRVLGIDFKVKWSSPSQAAVTVDSCALAQNYSELTCQILSATDEGVVHGLNPNINMKFGKHITGGCNVCTARIERRNRV